MNHSSVILIVQCVLLVIINLNCTFCQYNHQQHQHEHQNLIPSSSHFGVQHQHNFHIHHTHPTATPQPQSFQSDRYHQHREQKPSSSVEFDLEHFNQQTKQLQAQIHYLNQQQAKHIQSQINSVHHPNNEPHFDFMVNGNYSDLEKASEQFVNLGRLAGKHNAPPKVIKITKTLAVKQPVPVPYPVPVVKVIKEQIPVETSHAGYHGIIGHSSNSVSSPMTTEKPYEQVTYVPHRPTKSPAAAPPTAVSYQSYSSTTTPSPSEYDTEPFYIQGPHKEMIKIVPVPYYVDEDGKKHEIKTATAQTSHDSANNGNGHEYYTNQQHQHTASSESSHLRGDEGKFKTYSYSYHPHPTAMPQPQQHLNNHAAYAHEVPSEPEGRYYYHHQNVDSDEGATQTHHQHSHPSDSHDEPQHHHHHHQQHHENHDNYHYLTYEH